jgi:hypothetical protein
MSRRPAWLVIALALLGVLAAACGGTSAPTPLSQAQAGQDYLDDIAPVHTTAATFATDVTTWNLTTTNAEAAADAAPLIAAEQSFDAGLASTPWPATATSAIQTLIAQNKVIIADLEELSTITRAAVPAWEIKIDEDTVTDATDSNMVRSDLGLPQATLSA